ncbi:hypothetical protein ACHMW6_24910 [Pseudoduganella sp. UC29_106]|uniref:hypothetical protein n=1 Tax=Pseudoduganella sp. UC29_106 TaxID=3374553 RepID=UPI003756EC2A
MHSVFARGFLPLAMLGSVASFWYAYATGRDLQLAVIVPAAAILLVAMAAERRVPYRKDWAKGQGDTATDLLSTAVLFTLVDPMLKWLGRSWSPGCWREPHFPAW